MDMTEALLNSLEKAARGGNKGGFGVGASTVDTLFLVSEVRRLRTVVEQQAAEIAALRAAYQMLREEAADYVVAFRRPPLTDDDRANGVIDPSAVVQEALSIEAAAPDTGAPIEELAEYAEAGDIYRDAIKELRRFVHSIVKEGVRVPGDVDYAEYVESYERAMGERPDAALDTGAPKAAAGGIQVGDTVRVLGADTPFAGIVRSIGNGRAVIVEEHSGSPAVVPIEQLEKQ